MKIKVGTVVNMLPDPQEPHHFGGADIYNIDRFFKISQTVTVSYFFPLTFTYNNFNHCNLYLYDSTRS
jgi:hypothetical protein